MHPLHGNNAGIAQLVEQYLDMVEVVGSSPIPCTALRKLIIDHAIDNELFAFSASVSLAAISLKGALRN